VWRAGENELAQESVTGDAPRSSGPLSGAYVWSCIAGASLIAVGTGCFIVFQTGAPMMRWALVLAAWFVGLVIAAGLARAPARPAGGFVLLLAPVMLAATLLFDGQDGVRRWIAAGPLSFNVAAIVLPATVVALSATGTLRSWAWLAAPACLALLIAQPDASQATSFAAAIIFILVRMPGAILLRAAAIVIALAAAIAAWLRPDPLDPVADVEGIVQLAYQSSAVLAGLAMVLLAAALLAPGAVLLTQPDRRQSTAALALVIYLFGTALTPLAGQFPIPLLGMSFSPVLGYWLGVGLLIAHRKAAPPLTA
jgi:hypothetical protein